MYTIGRNITNSPDNLYNNQSYELIINDAK